MVVPPMTEAPLDNEIHNPVGVRSVGGDPFQGWRALAGLPWKGLGCLSEPTLKARMSSPHRQHAEPQRGSESLNRVK